MIEITIELLNNRKKRWYTVNNGITVATTSVSSLVETIVIFILKRISPPWFLPWIGSTRFQRWVELAIFSFVHTPWILIWRETPWSYHSMGLPIVAWGGMPNFLSSNWTIFEILYRVWSNHDSIIWWHHHEHVICMVPINFSASFPMHHTRLFSNLHYCSNPSNLLLPFKKNITLQQKKTTDNVRSWNYKINKNKNM